jgi:alcohol dehydrogenase (cytochrome c)
MNRTSSFSKVQSGWALPLERRRAISLLAALTAAIVFSGISFAAADRLRNASQEPRNWLMYHGGYAGWRYSTMKQITSQNVGALSLQWIFQTPRRSRFETTPLVLDGIMYITGPDGSDVYALDAGTGRQLWVYSRKLPTDLVLCCGLVNRGLAFLENTLFLATLDAHVIALNARDGSVLWDVRAADYREGYSFTLAPLAIKDKIIVGISGGVFGARGFIEAYDARTGKVAWRFYTVPSPEEPGGHTWEGDSWKTGGGGAWLTGTFDPDLNLIYWGVGNPAPAFDANARKGDNLYTNSIVALNPDTGKLAWHYQATPHDTHDWDAAQVPVLIDLPLEGKPRKLLVQANRNGFYYVLDRTNGQVLSARPYGRVTWAREVGRDGRPVRLPESEATPEGSFVCPGPDGATNWMSPSYSPAAGLFFVAYKEHCATYYSLGQRFRKGGLYMGGYGQPPEERPWGSLRALDPLTGEVRWEFKYFSTTWAGVLSTAGGVVFHGNEEGYLIALDAATGKELWHFQTGFRLASAPMTFMVNERQYIAIPSGNSILAFALPDAAIRRPQPPKR